MKIDFVMNIATAITLPIIIWVIAYKYIFINMPAATDGAPILGDIVYSVSLSIIASYIFFIFNIYIPEYRKEKEKKARLNAIFNYYINSLNDISQSIIDQIVKSGYYSSQGDNPDVYECMENISIYTDRYIRNNDIEINDARELDSFWRKEIQNKKQEVSLLADSIILNFHDELSPNLITNLTELSNSFELPWFFIQADAMTLYRYKDNFKKMFDATENVTTLMQDIIKQ